MSGRRVVGTRTYLEMKSPSQLVHAALPDAEWRIEHMRDCGVLNGCRCRVTGISDGLEKFRTESERAKFNFVHSLYCRTVLDFGSRGTATAEACVPDRTLLRRKLFSRRSFQVFQA